MARWKRQEVIVQLLTACSAVMLTLVSSNSNWWKTALAAGSLVCYAYLPAAFTHGDLNLEFSDEIKVGVGKCRDRLFAPVCLAFGHRAAINASHGQEDGLCAHIRSVSALPNTRPVLRLPDSPEDMNKASYKMYFYALIN